MPIISQLNTANTFSQWLTGTQDVISKINQLVEGGSGSIFYSNTNLSVANNLTIGGDLTVSGNLILDAIGFDDINANGSISAANNLTIGGQTTLNGNVTIGGDLTVSGNITLDQIGFDDIIANGSISVANNLTVSTNTSLQATTITLATVNKFDGSANTAVYANISSAYVLANQAYAAAVAATGDSLAFAIALG